MRTFALQQIPFVFSRENSGVRGVDYEGRGPTVCGHDGETILELAMLRYNSRCMGLD